MALNFKTFYVMRKTILFLLLLSAITLTSCSVKYPVVLRTASIDYLVHMNNNFFLTESNSVSFDYTPVGSMQVSLQDGWEVKKGKKDSGYYDMDDLRRVKYGDYAPATYEDALQHLVDLAKDSGADGIIGLKFHYQDAPRNQFGTKVGWGKVTVSGMAIKRDNNPKN